MVLLTFCCGSPTSRPTLSHGSAWRVGAISSKTCSKAASFMTDSLEPKRYIRQVPAQRTAACKVVVEGVAGGCEDGVPNEEWPQMTQMEDADLRRSENS